MQMSERIRSLVGQRVSMQLNGDGYASGILEAFDDDGEIELKETRLLDGKTSVETTFVRSYKDIVSVSVTTTTP